MRADDGGHAFFVLPCVPGPPTHTHRSARRGPGDEGGGTPHVVCGRRGEMEERGGEGAAPKKRNEGSETATLPFFFPFDQKSL